MEGSQQPSARFCSPRRLDVKVQRVDKGYPRATDDVFTGVPLDARNVFLYQGERGPGGRGPCCHPQAAPLCLAEGRGCTVGDGTGAGHAIGPGRSLWWGWLGSSKGRVLVPHSHVPALLGQPLGQVLVPAHPPFLPPHSSSRQVPLLPGQLLLENDTTLSGGPGRLRQVRHPAVSPALRTRPAHCSLPTAANPQAPVLQPDPPGHRGPHSLAAMGQPPMRWGLCRLPSRKGQGVLELLPGSCPARGAPAGEQDSHPASTGSAVQRRLPGANHTWIYNDFVFLLSQRGRVGPGSAGSWCPGTRPGQGRRALPLSCLLPTLPTSICLFLIKTILWTLPPSALSTVWDHGMANPRGAGLGGIVFPQGLESQCRWGSGCWAGALLPSPPFY